jgi:hypothetical protein
MVVVVVALESWAEVDAGREATGMYVPRYAVAYTSLA